MISGTPLRLALLGSFALRRGDQEIEIPASGQRLVALLALRDQPLTRLQIAETLWPEYPTGRALADLRTTLWRVNHSGERIVTKTPALLGLHADIEVDVHAIGALARRSSDNAARLTSFELDSMSLYSSSGDLLPGWYDEWLQDEREEFRQIRLHALEVLARELSMAGRHLEAIQAAMAAIRLEPLRETAHRTLIELHIAEGNWAEACRQFRRCQRLLMEELRVEPSESIRRLLEERSGFAKRTVPPPRHHAEPVQLKPSASRA
jgi:DNA-binding SARP family transcriptional activator